MSSLAQGMILGERKLVFESLDVSFNYIEDECANDLKELFIWNKSLRSLDLKSNLLRDKAGKAISEGVS